MPPFKLEYHILFFVFICCLFSVNLYAESNVKVFQTRQSAQSLIPSIAPLYVGQAKFTAKNNSLIVKAPEVILNEIEQLLKELDKPLQNLMIEVSSSLDGSNSYQQDSVSGRIIIDDDIVISNRTPKANNPNTTIRYGKNGSVIKSTHTRRSNSRNNPDNFKVRALEGTWAFIETGKQVPYYTSGGRYSPYQNSVELVDVTSGLEVYPTLNGERVTLKIRPRNHSINREYPDQINTRSVDTVISGHLGQWIYLGGAVNQMNDQSNGTLYSSKRHSDLDMSYRIKVNIID